MNNTAKYIAARTARAVKTAYSRQTWFERKPEIIKVLTHIQPDKPEDNIPGFLAYDVNGHGRMKMRTGRFLTRKLKLNGGLLPDTVIQQIAAQINTKLFNTSDEIRLDKGQQITENYENNVGGSSCMSGCKAEYTGLYADNPDKIKQLVMVSINDSARAIVHVLDNGQYHMSKVYATSESLKQRMINYACNEGWYYKKGDTTYRNDEHITDFKPLVVSGLDYRDGEIPYMDSIKGYRIENGKLTLVHTSNIYEGLCESTNGQLEDGYQCCNCGEYVGEDDAYSMDGDYYCSDCYDELFTYCEDCNNHYSNENFTWIEGMNKYVCDECLTEYYRCDDCGEWFTDTYSVDNGEKYVCGDCLDKYTQCDECGEHYEDTIYIDELSQTLCEDCENKLLVVKDCKGQLLL